MNQQMTIQDWRDARFHIRWSIYDRESYEAYKRRIPFADREERRLAHGQIVLDLRAPEGAPDGIHTVYHVSRQGRGQSCGVIVRDGMFVPHPTQAAILEAVAKSYNVNPADIRAGRDSIHHIFVEDIAWNPSEGKIAVYMGS